MLRMKMEIRMLLLGILNLRTRYQFTKSLQATVTIENITDQRYRPYSSGIAGAGRNFIMSIKYSL